MARGDSAAGELVLRGRRDEKITTTPGRLREDLAIDEPHVVARPVLRVLRNGNDHRAARMPLSRR